MGPPPGEVAQIAQVDVKSLPQPRQPAAPPPGAPVRRIEPMPSGPPPRTREPMPPGAPARSIEPMPPSPPVQRTGRRGRRTVSDGARGPRQGSYHPWGAGRRSPVLNRPAAERPGDRLRDGDPAVPAESCSTPRQRRVARASNWPMAPRSVGRGRHCASILRAGVWRLGIGLHPPPSPVARAASVRFAAPVARAASARCFAPAHRVAWARYFAGEDRKASARFFAPVLLAAARPVAWAAAKTSRRPGQSAPPLPAEDPSAFPPGRGEDYGGALSGRHMLGRKAKGIRVGAQEVVPMHEAPPRAIASAAEGPRRRQRHPPQRIHRRSASPPRRGLHSSPANQTQP